MNLTKNEARKNIYQQLRSVQGEPLIKKTVHTQMRSVQSHPVSAKGVYKEMEELDVDDWPFSWCFHNREDTGMLQPSQRVLHLAIDNRSITCEGLEYIIKTAVDYCKSDKSGGSRKNELTGVHIYAFTESITNEVREFIEDYEVRSNTSALSPMIDVYLYTIDCEAKTPIYRESKSMWVPQNFIVRHIITPAIS